MLILAMIMTGVCLGMKLEEDFRLTRRRIKRSI